MVCSGCNEKMNIKCNLITVENPSTLDKESLPNTNLNIKPIIGKPIPNLNFFSNLISEFNKNGDCLINEIFYPLLNEKKFKIQVIATHGIEEPYDAWSTKYKGKVSFFFNLSLWPINDLKRAGMPVIKHEITHVLLSDLLKRPDKKNSLETIEHILINEGIAHYIGYTRDRSRMLIDYADKWETAESKLSDALKKLSDKNLSDKEKEKLIYQSNTGSYWDKYAAIAGMFRAAKIHETQGAKGLIDCIRKGNLPQKNQ